MENNNLFDLNAAIRTWRENLAQSPNFRGDDLDELESHLRDSVTQLESQSLSEEEAFTIAVRRVGPGAMLSAEFGRINTSGLWIDRMLWMAIGWASVSIVLQLQTSVSIGLMIPPLGLPPFVLAILWVSPLILAGLVLRSLARPDGNIPQVMKDLLSKPGRLSLTFLGLGLVSDALNLWALSRIMGGLIWAQRHLVVLFTWTIIALLIFVLARRRLQPIQG
jgi:hypothetical protein